ncbi:hypothetical protein ACVW00_002177 [Marmoricola sp. URHA0025 HA25]
MASLPKFAPTDAPRDALRRALEYLADVVPDVQLVRSRNLLRRSRGTTQLHLSFQSSTRSRRGIGVWCSMNLSVHDKALGAWRADHPQLTGRTGDVLTTYGRLGPGIQLYGPLERHRPLSEVPSFIVDEALPRLDWFETPARALADIPAQERRNSLRHLVEWAVSRGERDVALEMLRRSFDEVPAMRERTDEQRRTGVPAGSPGGNAGEMLGPAITRLGLLAPDEPLP